MSAALGLFLIAFSTLALEISLARLLSVTTWYHLAFFAISTAMLGMTAGATTVYLRPDWFHGARRLRSVTLACIAYALVVPPCLVLLCLLPLQLTRSVMSVWALLLTTAACSIPFYCSGIAISAVLTTPGVAIGRLYASDLLGAALGCLFVLAGLELVDAPSLILLCGAVGGLAALAFGRTVTGGRGPVWPRRTMAITLLLGVGGLANSLTPAGIRPMVVKGGIERIEDIVIERWNSYSRVVVYRPGEDQPQLWGPSPLTPSRPILQYRMKIDGAAGTVLRRFETLDDLDHLRYDVTNLAYALRPPGPVCIIGVGAGRDVQSAIRFGFAPILGIDVNPIFIDLLTDEFRTFAGVADRPDVALVVDEARSVLARSRERYDVVQMSLIDTWAATGAGAFSLSENALYTVEAWQTFFRRLSDAGLFTVSRFYSPQNLGETGRIVSLAVATLLAEGVTAPSAHLAMVTAGPVSTLLVGRRPFDAADIARLDRVAADLQFDLAVVPGREVAHPALRAILAARSSAELHAAIAEEPLDYSPPTDENPYFFNMLRLGSLREMFGADPGVIRGNLIANGTLLGLIAALTLLTVATVVVPLAVNQARGRSGSGRGGSVLWPGAIYFAAIGAGFMFVEIGLMQRLAVFLGHPVYALGILLTTIIGSTGLGSALSERLPVTERPWLRGFPLVTAGLVLAAVWVLSFLTSAMVTASMPARIAASVAVMTPLGLLMGLFVPTGLRLTRRIRQVETPWYWALNGILGVLCSAVAVWVAIYFGIAVNFYLGAACYALTLPCLAAVERAVHVERPEAVARRAAAV